MKALLKVLAFFSLLLLAAAALAQSVATADMHVSVRDPKGAAITNAKVTVSDPSKGFERSVATNIDGDYLILQVPPGTYSVAIEAPGFAKLVAQGVNVTVGQSAQIPVTLQVAAASETVTVSTAAELVETQRTSSTTTIEEKRIENLPINGRNYINFTLTNSQATRDVAPSIGAAPTSGINFGGQRARSNLVNVDGVDAEDNSVNGIRSTVSQDAVQEFQIITNSYNPEYGRASGGVVNIITKSGTNDFHGSAFGYLRNRAIQAVNPFSTVPDPAYTRVQAGFTAGGALQKDKTWYFLSYETTRRQETGFSTIGSDNFGLVPLPNAALFGLPASALVTPDQATFLSAVGPNPATVGYAQLAAGSAGVALQGTPGSLTPLGFFPESAVLGFPLPLPASFQPLVPQIGNFPVSEGTTLVSARLDHRFNDHNTGLLRLNVSPSTVTGIEVNAQNQNFGQNGFSRTSVQSYRDFAITGQDTVEIGNNIINEGRIQYARRGLLYNFNNQSPFGNDPAVNIVGFAFVGREPFSSLRREEQRWQLADNVSWLKGNHSIKFGVDLNYVPVNAAFQVNFGGVYNFGGLDATSISPFFNGFPGFSPVQAYGLGIPTTFVQGIGNPNAKFNNFPIGAFIQDSWRIKPNLTLNYGVRYDVEIAPGFQAPNQLSAAAYNALGIQKGFQTDTNNIAPRIGIAWDPWNNGKTVIRASYGMFYDHPLLGLLFLGAATDGVGTPQVLLFGGAPCDGTAPGSPFNLNATNVFQGTLTNANCLPSAAAFGYLPGQQKFDPFFPNSLWTNQNFLAAGFPLINQPFGFPTGKNFQYAYSEQANLSVERDLGGGFALSVAYNFNGGHHLNRPINANPVRQDLLVANWERALAAAIAAGIPQNSPNFPSSPLAVNICPTALGGLQPAGLYAPAAMLNFFRPSGLNPSLAGGPCLGDALALQSADGLGLGVPVPFSDMVANYSNGSSVYHGLTTNLRKRFTKHYEFLASYTWSHTIDDSTDLQSLLSPQDSFVPGAERANSTFDQRHRFVFSAVYQSGKLSGDGFGSKLFSYWTVAPIIEYDSGRPFTILTAENANFQFQPNSARPDAVPAGSPTNACGFAPVASKFSPTGFFQVPCFIDADAAAALATSNPLLLDGISSANMDGNVGRNSATKPSDVFTDLRVSRLFHLGERVQLEGIVDMFNLINKFNVADVNPLYTNAGQPSSAFDPRQFQFALRLTW